MKRLQALFIPLFLSVLLVGNAPAGFSIYSSDCFPASASVPVDNDDPFDAGDSVVAEIPRLETRLPVLAALPFKLFSRPECLPPAPAELPRVWQFRQRAAAAPRAPSFTS